MNDPRRDPSWKPDPIKRVMGAPIKDPTMNSLAPAAQEVVKEAKSTRFQISLLLLIAMMGGAYWLGRDSTKGISEAQVKVLTSATDARLQEVVKGLEAVAEIQKAAAAEHSREHSQLREAVHANTLETQLVKSHVTDRRR